MVETIDKKNNFPEPSVRRRKPVEDPKSPVANSSATDASTGKVTAKTNESKKVRIITPELRTLLNREIEVLDKETVQEHGGGVGNSEPIRSR